MLRWLTLAVLIPLWFVGAAQLKASDLTKVTEVEGITEYRLDNGLRVLLFPDNSKDSVTVNITYLVGSRHEGYGESGMAHLLEHMLFKGTPTHLDIPKELKDRGASMNGTTWYDRTNYYETMPSTRENLEFALELEADRMVNSMIRGEDLASEMTVVRNEFERGENNHFRVLMQRIFSSAYEWHNYGKSTIGNRSDIERVPVKNLRQFYTRFYQPDNAVLVVAGKFDEDFALEKIEQHFGSIPAPERELNTTYTEEPAQDGEHRVSVRRVGDVGIVAAAYHVPAGSDPEFAAVHVASQVLSTQPSGRLYKQLVEPKIAVSSFATAFSLHDPGLLFAGAVAPGDADLDEVETAMLNAIEQLGQSEVTEAEVNRAKSELLKSWEDSYSNSQSAALALSDWTAQGDWRLMFLHRDRLEKVSAEDVKEVAAKYFTRNNATIGQFIPTESAQRVAVAPRPNLEEVVENYTGREAMAQGEVFEPTIQNIGERSTFGELANGSKFAFLPKKTRGEVVYGTMAINYGNQKSLVGQSAASDMMSNLLSRGTRQMSYDQIQDRLTELKANLRVTGSEGTLRVTLQTRKQYLPEVLKLAQQILREPAFPDDQFELLKQEVITDIESSLTDPQALASNALRRKLTPYPSDDVRYVPTLEEEIQRYESLTLDEVKKLYQTQLSGENASIAVVGDFEPESIKPILEETLADWKSETTYERILPKAFDLKAESIEINTPDKANAVYLAGSNFELSSDDERYPALMIGNYILGGSGGLSNRLANRVRQQEGLSYTVGSGFQASSFTDYGSFTMYAITNPDNRDKLVATIDEEVAQMRASGVTDVELQEAKKGYLESAMRSRTSDPTVAGLLVDVMQTERDLEFYADREDAIRALDKPSVDQAFQQFVNPDKMITVTAGDFQKSEDNESSDK